MKRILWVACGFFSFAPASVRFQKDNALQFALFIVQANLVSDQGLVSYDHSLIRRAKKMQIVVKLLSGKKANIDIESTDTIKRIKERVEEKVLPPLRYIFNCI